MGLFLLLLLFSIPPEHIQLHFVRRTAVRRTSQTRYLGLFFHLSFCLASHAYHVKKYPLMVRIVATKKSTHTHTLRKHSHRRAVMKRRHRLHRNRA